MITVGGNITNNYCDWERKGVAVLDLSTIEWGSVFRTNASSYQIPNDVLRATNGTGDGNATIGEPAAGWSDEGLKDVFWKSRWTVPTTWASGPSSSDQTDIGAIAGGAAGGVIFLALVLTLFFIFRRKHRRSRSPAELHSDEIHLNELPSEKKKYELQGMNENDPAELAAPTVAEMEAPREFVEADSGTATRAVELPGTSVAKGGVAGVPVVRTPGDELPETPQYTPGLRRPNSRDNDANTGVMKDADVQKSGTEEGAEYFQASAAEPPRDHKEKAGGRDIQTLAEEAVERLTRTSSKQSLI
jgi:hypothetical protein